jgi:nitrile hydratase subunit beta
MNGVHDMGGMHGMGPIETENDEPVFHERWEGRAFALTLAMAAWRKWTLDGSRHQRELIPSAEYLRISYYEKWIAGLVELLVKSGLVTSAEVERGSPVLGSPKATPPLTADKVLPVLARGGPASRDVSALPRFHVGQRVSRPQLASDRSYAPAALRARQARHDRPGSWCLCLPGYQRPFSR